MQSILMYIIIMMKIVESKPPLRIIGGSDATHSKYPYVVRIEQHSNLNTYKREVIERRDICTGSVLTTVWTVSAAHCFYFNLQVKNDTQSLDSLSKRSEGQYTYVLWYGAVNTTLSDTDTFSRIDYYIKHHAYKLILLPHAKDVRLNNDVALAHHQPILLKQYARLTALDFTSLIGHEVTIAGYGLTYNTKGELFTTLVIRKPLQVLRGIVKKCPSNKLIYPGLCVAGECGQAISGACSGDSGGPVLHPAGIVGVMSKASLCMSLQDAHPARNVVFATALGPYMHWISDHINH